MHVYVFEGRYKSTESNRYFFVLGIIVLMSFSSSGFLGYSMVLFILYFISRNVFKNILLITLFIIILLPLLYFFVNYRYSLSLDSVDRYKFLLATLSTLEERDIYSTFFTLSANPLPSHISTAFNYMDSKLSFNEDGSFYSVVLHSMIMRMVIDFGLIPLLFFLLCPVVLLRLRGFSHKCQISCLCIIFSNSVSVSGLGNPFVALGMLIFVFNRKNQSLVNNFQNYFKK